MHAPATVKSVFCILTPRGRGAIATTWLQSQDLNQTMDRLFDPVSDRPFSEARDGQLIYGHWRYGASSGEDVVVSRLSANTAEVYSHGGNSIPKSVADALTDLGFTELNHAQAAETIQHDIWRGEIQYALASASTRKTSLLLLRQLDLLPAAIASVKSFLQNCDGKAAKIAIESILAWQDFGMHLTHPWSVVLFGPPNVGKSSLINAMVGFNRVIVHDSPGTTRDVVSELTAFDGWPVLVSDTAGFRSASDSIEEQGIQRAETMISAADLLVQVTDATNPGNRGLRSIGTGAKPQAAKRIDVFNKVDLVNSQDLGNDADALFVSAKTGLAIDKLVERIGRELVPETPPDDQAIPICSGQIDRLSRAIVEIDAGNLQAAMAALQPLLDVKATIEP